MIGDISKWDTSNVTNMFSMFDGATKFNQPLDKWDVSNVTDMSYIFEEAKKFNQPLNNWIFINFTGILGPLYMFKGAKNFDSKIPFFKDFEFHHFADKCKYLGLFHKYAEKHQHDF